MPSRRFNQLSRRLEQLQRHLLPKLSPTGNYSARQYDRVRSYRLLAHAEIEAFLEDRGRSLVNLMVQRWQADGRPRKLLLSILTFHEHQIEMTANKLKDAFAETPSFSHKCIVEAQRHYNAVLTKNHGIREENLLRILLPLGLESEDIDSTWLATTDGFGAERGETAHTTFGMQTPPDPATESRRVRDIVAGLQQIDEILSKMR